MATYNNLDSLYKALGKQIEVSLGKMADDVVREAKEIIWREFYVQYTPKDPAYGGYQRTEQLLNGCIRSAVKHSGNTYTVEIYMDDSTATLGYVDDEIYDVWLLAASGIHGHEGIKTKGRYWQEIRNFVFDNWADLLIKNGLNVVRI